MKLNEHIEIAGQVQTSQRTCVVVTVESHDARRFVALTSFYRPRDERIRGWLTGHRVVVPAQQARDLAALLSSIASSADLCPSTSLPPTDHFPFVTAQATLATSGRSSAPSGAAQ